jgi:hypothetical protein
MQAESDEPGADWRMDGRSERFDILGAGYLGHSSLRFAPKGDALCVGELRPPRSQAGFIALQGGVDAFEVTP